MSRLYQQIYDLVKAVPYGQVTTYGQIALLTGNPRRAKVVGQAMYSCKDDSVPCHRVVNKQGRISPIFANQYQLLKAEGIEFVDDQHVNMEKHAQKR